jgi:hypothetical protein
MKTLQTILTMLFFCGILIAETVESVSADSLVVDSSATVGIVNTSDSAAIADTSARVEIADTSAGLTVTDTLPDPDRVSIDSVDQKKEKTKLIKRTFDSRQQVSLGIGMMIFIAVIMTTAQSWNPKN